MQDSERDTRYKEPKKKDVKNRLLNSVREGKGRMI